MEFTLLLRFISLIKLNLVYPVASTLKGENSNVGLHSDIYRLVSFKPGMKIDNSELFSLVPF